MDYPEPYIMIVDSRFYTDIADEMVRGATEVLDAAGATSERYSVPGALEIPSAIRFAVRSLDYWTGRRRFDGYIALGCVIRGETAHYDLVCQESFRGLSDLMSEYTLAIGNGILTCDTREQAMERAAVDRRNKGGEVARTCLAMIDLKNRFRLYPR